MIGFALEPADRLAESAREKLRRKGLREVFDIGSKARAEKICSS